MQNNLPVFNNCISGVVSVNYSETIICIAESKNNHDIFYLLPWP